MSANFDFGGHISTFRAENTPKSEASKGKNNAQTTSEHLQNNFQKVKKNDFFGPENGQITGTNFCKSVDFLFYFGPKSPNIASKVVKPIIKSLPLSATHLTIVKTLRLS